jgi:hypothetical protein
MSRLVRAVAPRIIIIIIIMSIWLYHEAQMYTLPNARLKNRAFRWGVDKSYE